MRWFINADIYPFSSLPKFGMYANHQYTREGLTYRLAKKELRSRLEICKHPALFSFLRRTSVPIHHLNCKAQK
jgi:hypothetical protein